MLTQSAQTILATLTILFGLSASSSLTGHPKDNSTSSPDQPIVTIGEEVLTRIQVDKMLRLLPPAQRSLFSKPSGKEAFANFIVRSKLYSREARERGWDVRPAVQQIIRQFQSNLEKNQVRGLPIENDDDRKQVLRLFTESLLVRVVEKELKGEIPVSAEEIKGYYQEHAASFDIVRGRRLVVRSETTNYFFGDNRTPAQSLSDEEAKTKAEKLRLAIQEGADFEVMAAKHSEDPLTSGIGGDTGIVRRRQPNDKLVTPPEFDLLHSLEVGDLSSIVRTPMGFALLKLEEKRKMSLAEAQPEIEVQIQNQKLLVWYEQLRLQHRIVIDPSFFEASDNATTPLKATE